MTKYRVRDRKADVPHSIPSMSVPVTEGYEKAQYRVVVDLCIPINNKMHTKSVSVYLPKIQNIYDRAELKRLTRTFLKDCAVKLRLNTQVNQVRSMFTLVKDPNANPNSHLNVDEGMIPEELRDIGDIVLNKLDQIYVVFAEKQFLPNHDQNAEAGVKSFNSNNQTQTNF